jgi:hypothetical protein
LGLAVFALIVKKSFLIIKNIFFYNGSMGGNYTPIDDLIKKCQKQAVSRPKEVEPAPSPAPEKYHLREVVEHEPEEEVRPYVTHRQETVAIPEELEKVGVQATSTPKFTSYQNVKLPISDDKVLEGLHAPIDSSFRWLATLATYILKKAHLGLKKIHGHAVRIITKS